MIKIIAVMIPLMLAPHSITSSLITEKDKPYVKQSRTHQRISQFVEKHGKGKIDAATFAREVSKTKYPKTLTAIAAVESHFDPTAKSNKGAKGVFQIHPSSGYTSTGNVYKDMRIAERILADFHERTNLRTAISMYNSGHGRCRTYITKVTTLRREI